MTRISIASVRQRLAGAPGAASNPRLAARLVLAVLVAANLVAAVLVLRPWEGSADSLEKRAASLRLELKRQQVQAERLRGLVGKVQTARTEGDDVVMGIRHRTAPMEGVQFHPESVLTPEGPHLLANFLRLAGEGEAALLDEVAGSFALAGMAGDNVASAEPAAGQSPVPATHAAPTHTEQEAAVAGRVEVVR